MLLSVFENNYFLLALGWGIINSIWQTGLLWLVYKGIELSSNNLTAIFRYYLSLLLLSVSFLWFIVSTYQGYAFAANPGSSYQAYINFQWQTISQQFSGAFQFISCAYLLCLSFHLVKLINRFNSLLLLKNSQLIKAPVDTRIFVNNTAAHLGIKRKVQVWISKNVDVPCVIGYFKPLVLLPFTVTNNLNPEQVEAIILHELAHIKRNDYLVNVLQSFVELILFFNPFVMLLGSAARKERENCCDDWVLNYQYNKHGYAKALMVLEEQRQLPVKKLALAATSGEKQLLNRVKRLFIVNPQTGINHFQRVKLAGICLTMVLVMLMLLPGLQLPKPAAGFSSSTILPVKMLNTAFIVSTSNPEEIKFKKIINSKPVQPVTAAIQKAKTKPVFNKDEDHNEVEYSEALINEELLNASTAAENISTLVAEKAATPSLEYLVKVEEENSGSKEKTSYLLEYKITNGKSEIKPLVILNNSKREKIKTLKIARKTAVSRNTTTVKKVKITS